MLNADDDQVDQNLKEIFLQNIHAQRSKASEAWLKSNRKSLSPTNNAKDAEKSAQDTGLADVQNQQDRSMQEYLNLLTDLELDELLRLILPIIKLEPGKYLIGTKIRQIIITNNGLIIRTGGGFTELNQAMAQEAKIQCLQISLQMERKRQSFKEAMIDILTQKKASISTIKKFIKDMDKVKLPF